MSCSSFQLLKAGLILLDPDTSRVLRVISLQYNRELLSLQIQGESEGGDPSEALRLNGPTVERLKLDAEIDAVRRERPLSEAETRGWG